MYIKNIFQILGKKDQKYFIFIFFLIFISVFLELLGISLVIPITQYLLFDSHKLVLFDHYLENIFGFFHKYFSNKVIISALLMISIYLFKTILLIIIFFLQAKFSWHVQKNISQNLIQKYIFQTHLYHTNKNSSEVVRNIVTEVSSFNGIILSSCIFFSEILITIGISLFLMWYNLESAIILLFIFIGSSLIYQLCTKNFLINLGKLRQESESSRIKTIQEILGGIKEIKIFKSENFFLSKFRNSNLSLAKAGRWQTTLQSMPRLTMEFIAILAFSILLIVMYYSKNNLALILPSLIIYAFAAFRILPSVNRILNAIQILRFSDKVINLLNKEMTLKVNNITYLEKKLDFSDDIKVNKLSYKFPFSDKFTLKNISLSIKKNTIIGVIGDSGSGKSTLINLLLGLLKPTKGSIEVNGVKIHQNQNNLKWINNIKFVPQNVYIIDSSIKNNVAFGVKEKNIDKKKLIKALKLANINSLVESSKKGVNLIIGERGSKLSGGQIQRLGIARALYHDSDIILMDEPTSSLDSVTESLILKTIKNLKKYKTIVLVSHKKSSLTICDKIYRIDNGILNTIK